MYSVYSFNVLVDQKLYMLVFIVDNHSDYK